MLASHSHGAAESKMVQSMMVFACAGVEVSPENLAAGLKFTWPTYKSGLRVMISAHLQTGSTWAFSEIFSWQVGSRLASQHGGNQR